jgi:plasmid maintenance system antidote protein VapI
MATKRITPIHPGEILLEEFLKPLDISRLIGEGYWCPGCRINEIVHSSVRSLLTLP